MKKLFILAVLLMLGRIAFAQDAQLSDKVSAIETKIVNMEATIASMQKTLSEVTAQNLALKQSISLQPTVAESKTDDGIDYRLLKVTGDKRSGTVEMTFSVTNTTKRDIDLQFSGWPNVVDVNGKSYNNHKSFDLLQMAGQSCLSSTKLMPDTPVEMIIKFPVDAEPAYIKAFDYKAYNHDGIRFINIPIKWE